MKWAALDHHFIGCHCLPLLTKMINFITVYFKLASKAFYIYSTSIIYHFHFFDFFLCRCMHSLGLYSVFLIFGTRHHVDSFPFFDNFGTCIAKALHKTEFHSLLLSYRDDYDPKVAYRSHLLQSTWRSVLFFRHWKLLFSVKTTAEQQSIYSPQYDWRRQSAAWECEYAVYKLRFNFFQWILRIFQLNINT